MNKAQKDAMMLFVAVAALVFFMCNMNGKSGYSIKKHNYSEFVRNGNGNGKKKNGKKNGNGNGNGMNKGTGLASSLLPREIASAEDFGQFAPEDILKGQNFLEPRQHIGFPETIGGALRNANQQIRNEPPNPKDPFVWNNSTIVPDMMQRSLCA
jgi:hypothetical protein